MIVQEQLQIRGGDRESQTFREQQLHVCHTDDFAPRVEQRTAAVARIDFGRRLDVDLPFDVPILRADDPLRHRPLQSQRVADREDLFPLLQVILGCQEHRLESQILLHRDLQQRQVEEGIQGHDPNIVDAPAVEFPVGSAMENRHGDAGFLFDDVVVRHAKAAFVHDESGTEPPRSLHEHHALAEFLGQILHAAARQLGRPVELVLLFLQRWIGGVLRRPARLDLRERNLDHVDTDVHQQHVPLLLQHVPFQLVPGLQFKHLGMHGNVTGKPDGNQGGRSQHSHHSTGGHHQMGNSHGGSWLRKVVIMGSPISTLTLLFYDCFRWLSFNPEPTATGAACVE